MHIRFAEERDIPFLSEHDIHIQKETLKVCVSFRRVLIAEEDGCPAGWLRWNLFWDNTPFMNMLFLLPEYRRRGYGTALVFHWEAQMREAGYPLVLTSTLSDETAQLFYRKLGYMDSGALLLPGEALEILFAKKLSLCKR